MTTTAISPGRDDDRIARLRRAIARDLADARRIEAENRRRAARLRRARARPTSCQRAAAHLMEPLPGVADLAEALVRL